MHFLIILLKYTVDYTYFDVFINLLRKYKVLYCNFNCSVFVLHLKKNVQCTQLYYKSVLQYI